MAPSRPECSNLSAAAMARRLSHVNGYAEGTDGAVFVSGMVSLGFVETDTREIVRKAARLISPLSPYRQCLDMIISMAEAGKQPQEIFQAVNDRWGIEYPRPTMRWSTAGLWRPAYGLGKAIFSPRKIWHLPRRISRTRIATRRIPLRLSPRCMGCPPFRQMRCSSERSGDGRHHGSAQTDAAGG